jgi:ABC-2 type transport system ATP-binding protein
MAEQVISIAGLTKDYRSGGRVTRALEDLTLDVQQGEIFGYLGPNGAGKTTTIRLLLDLIRPTAGQAKVLGLDANQDSVALHRRVGFLPGELNLWKGRTSNQIVHYLASLRGDPAPIERHANELAERLQFDMTKRIRDYSSGNKRKLGLIIAMMHKPEVLILDEPTNGLDPLMQQVFNQMMKELRDEGRTIFLSSHVLSEVQAICERVGILRDGRLKAVERIEDLVHVDFRWVTMTFRDAPSAAWARAIEALDNVSHVELVDHALRVRVVGDLDPMLRVVQDGYIRDIAVANPTLEDIFLAFYGGNGRGEAVQL